MNQFVVVVVFADFLLCHMHTDIKSRFTSNSLDQHGTKIDGILNCDHKNIRFMLELVRLQR